MVHWHLALASIVAAFESVANMGSAIFRLKHCPQSELGTDLFHDESLKGNGVGVANVIIIQEGEGLLQELPLLLRAAGGEHLRRCQAIMRCSACWLQTHSRLLRAVVRHSEMCGSLCLNH